MRILILFVLTLGISFFAAAQEMGKEKRDGKIYTIHAVEAGNTLYGLHRKYNVAIDDIIKANPSTKEGLKIGQKLYIPFVAEIDNKQVDTTFVHKIHKVKRKETLYGISKQYDCKVAELIELNPGVEEGLKVGRELKIPTDEISSIDNSAKNQKEERKPEKNVERDIAQDSTIQPGDSITKIEYQVEFQDSVVEYTVQKGETLYSISRRFMVPIEKLIEDNKIRKNTIKPGQELQIVLKKERIKEVEIREIVKLDSSQITNRPLLVPKKEVYKILVALPLKINENAEVLSGVYTSSTKLNKLTDLSVEFLMGAQMAIDSLEKLGLNASVEFFDTEGNLKKLKTILENGNTNNFDIVIGPFYPKLIEYTASWGLNNKVPVVAVTKIPTKVLENNPYVLSMIPSELTLIAGMAKYLAENHATASIVMINGESNETKQRISFFKDVFNKNLPKDTTASIKMTALGDVSGRVLVKSIDTDRKNFVICLSDDVQQIMKFVNTLNAAKNYTPKYGKSDIVMVGLQSWREINALNSYYKNRFTFHFAASNYLNYDLPETFAFTKEYRSRYNSDPSKYAFHGYDVMLSQLSELLLGYPQNDGLMNFFDVTPVGDQHGNENSSVFISKQKDFEIELLDIITNKKNFDVRKQ
ncbi:PBP1 and LysM peptidoglycan-binding domain-containing protein [Brumimicrobium salinarum]|nr:LysM peptidoglycan-binding domain-containing protein [Brumimicrobium salinarum]